MLKVRCPSCGKSAAVPETDVGLPAVCLACGARYTLPELTPVAAADPGAAAAGAVAGEPGDENGRFGWVGWGGVALVLVVAIVAVLLVARARPDPIDAQTASRYKSQAEAAATAGRLAESYRKYHELELIVGNRTVRDPQTRSVVEKALADKDRVYALLLDQMERQARTKQAAAGAGAGARPGAADGALTAPATRPEPADQPDAVAVAPPAASPGRPDGPSRATTRPAPASPESSVPTTAPTPEPPNAVATAPDSGPSPAPGDARAPAPSTPPDVAAAPDPTPGLGRPAVRPLPEPAYGVTDEQIGRSIQRGVDNLLAQFNPRTHALRGFDLGRADGGGRNALAVYALLQCGQTLKDERLNVRGPAMDAMITAMKKANLRVGHPQVYALALRASALALFNRPQDSKTLKADVESLIRCHSGGAYWYSADPRPPSRSSGGMPWDNSNSQYGLLGVWSGAEAGVEVPSGYWAAVNEHWESTQHPDGQWAYAPDRAATITMTMAGIASLFVTHDWLDAPRSGSRVGREPFSKPLQKAIDWLEAGDNAVDLEGVHTWWGYAVYGIERVGLASGFKHFGRHDWYREIAERVVAGQADDGSWGDAAETSYALLFLARGRHPILMNKLRFDGYWANRPRDVSNLTRFASRQLERELNWQVVPLRPLAPAPDSGVRLEAVGGGISRPQRRRQGAPVNRETWAEWLDSPILYFASHKPPKLSDADYDNLRGFVQAGGLLFTHADGEDSAFDPWVERELAPKLFPAYELRELPPDHPLFTLVYKIDDPQLRPRLRGIFNGARLLMVHSPTDVARAWQVRDQKTKRQIFQLGVNMFLYAAGKRDLRNRLESPYVSDPGEPANGTIRVARLSYPGNWDPEPGAWRRFSRWFQRQTGSGVTVRQAELSSQALDPRAMPLAHLTGTAHYDFTAAQVAAVRRYVESGGVLLIDNCGGTGPFDQSVRRTLLAKAFPDAKLRPLAVEEHPLFRARGRGTGTEDVSRPRLRSYVADRMGDVSTPFMGLAAGRGRVIFTPLDLTAGLLGTRTWGIAGFEPDYAQSFLKNLVFWTVDGSPDPSAPATRPGATQPTATQPAVGSAGTAPGRPAAPPVADRPVARPPSAAPASDAEAASGEGARSGT